MFKTDVLVIGSEGAGSRAAVAASEQGVEVIMVTKGLFTKSGATITAGADIDVDSKSCCDLFGLKGDPQDSPEIFFEDIVIEGKYINDQRLVEVHVRDAPIRVKELADRGMKITGFIHAPGHRYPRGIYTSGKEQMRAMRGWVRERDTIQVVENTMMTDLLTCGGRVVGAVGVDLYTGEFTTIVAKAVILATGGGMMVFPVSTAPQELTGDGQVMAWRAGAELVDMEMTQFLPGCLIEPLAWRGLGISFNLCCMGGGVEAYLLNRHGYRFMKDWDPERMERSTRDILSIAMMNEVIEGRGSPSGGVYMSLAHLPHNVIENYPRWFGSDNLTEDWVFKGFDLKELVEHIKRGYAVEVGPASHFFMGGVRVNERCEASLSGLYAAGEVAGGLHGGNRLSGNACTQIFVQGAISGRAAAEYARGVEFSKIDEEQVNTLQKKLLKPLERRDGVKTFEFKKQIQKLAWENVGVLRSGSYLGEALKEIQRMKEEDLPRVWSGAKERVYNREWVESIQVENLLTLLEAIARSALMREESRGAHYRKDFPKTDNRNWLKNIIIKNVNGKIELTTRPVVVTQFELPKE